MARYDNSLGTYKQTAAEAAKDLCYGEEVIERIRAATTHGEIERILRDARHGRG